MASINPEPSDQHEELTEFQAQVFQALLHLSLRSTNVVFTTSSIREEVERMINLNLDIILLERALRALVAKGLVQCRPFTSGHRPYWKEEQYGIL